MPEPFIGVEVMETVGNGKETRKWGNVHKIISFLNPYFVNSEYMVLRRIHL